MKIYFKILKTLKRLSIHHFECIRYLRPDFIDTGRCCEAVIPVGADDTKADSHATATACRHCFLM